MKVTSNPQGVEASVGLASGLVPVPLVVTAFVAFCVLATLAQVLLLVSYRFLPEAATSLTLLITPFVGWLPAMPYMFALYWALHLRWRPKPFAHLAAIGLLVLGAAFGAFDYLRHVGRETYGNPMLTASAWQPLWTVVLPLLWCGLLLTPKVLLFRRSTSYRPA